MARFGRIVTAMVTPFDTKGNVDFEKTTLLIEYLLKNGTDSLVITGTTGESPTLTKQEKLALYDHVVKVVDKRVPVIAGTGNYNTKESIELTKEAEKIGVDGILLVTPYYNKPSQEGLYQHFRAIAMETELPIMIYNIPGRSVIEIAPETVIRLSQIPNIVAVKDAGGDLDKMTQIIANTADDFELYVGDDSLTLPAMSIGAVGVVSVASHVIGKEMQAMINSYLAGDVQKAAKWHQHLLPLMKQLFAQPSPAPVKTALQLKGIHVGTVRLPLVPLNAEEREELRRVLNNVSQEV